jgi:hypothetical protein
MVCDALYEQKMYDLTYVEQYKGDSRARNGGGVGVKYLVDSGSENIHAVFLGRDPSELKSTVIIKRTAHRAELSLLRPDLNRSPGSNGPSVSNHGALELGN